MSFASGAPGCMNMRFKDVSQKRGQSVEITKKPGTVGVFRLGVSLPGSLRHLH